MINKMKDNFCVDGSSLRAGAIDVQGRREEFMAYLHIRTKGTTR